MFFYGAVGAANFSFNFQRVLDPLHPPPSSHPPQAFLEKSRDPRCPLVLHPWRREFPITEQNFPIRFAAPDVLIRAELNNTRFR